MEAWPGTASLGVCITCTICRTVGYVTQFVYALQGDPAGVYLMIAFLLIQFVRWLYWLWSYYWWSHPLSSDEACPGGLQFGELQRDFPRNLSQLQRCALLPDGPASESTGTKECTFIIRGSGAEIYLDVFFCLLLPRLWSWSKLPRSILSH